MNLYNFITNTPNAQPVAQKRTIQRSPPTCSYCGTKGHTIRRCMSQKLINLVRKLESMIWANYPLEYVSNWLQTLDINDLRLIVQNLRVIIQNHSCKPYAKHSKDECISILMHAVSSKWSRTAEHVRSMYLGCLRSYNVVHHILTRLSIEDVPQLYITYCINNADLFPPDLFDINPSVEECDALCHTLITHTLSEAVETHIISRFQNFFITTMRRIATEEEDEEYVLPASATSSANHVKYEIVDVVVPESVQLHCPICMETTETPNIATTSCDHQFCKDCITTLIDSNKYHRQCCPLCREPIHKLVCGTL